MVTQHTHYSSQNGIYFHHLTSNGSDGKDVKRLPESHNQIEIMLLLSGDVEYKVDGNNYRVSPGDVIIINAHELHSLKINPDITYERYTLMFTPNFVPQLNNMDLTMPFVSSHLYQHIIPQGIVKKSKIAQLLNKVRLTCADESKFRDAKIISLIVELIVEINVSVDNLLTNERNFIPPPISTNKLLKSIIDYINSHIKENIVTANIAAFIGISESYLYRFFMKNMGVSLHRYIIIQKMQLAVTLISQGHLPKNVAEQLGYDYYTTFYKHYKSVFNATPSQ